MRALLLMGLVAATGCTLITSLDGLGSPNAPGADAGADAADTDAPSDSGGCGDTMVTAANCGSCGHDCLGGQCNAGRCQPVAIASAQSSPGYIAVDGAFVYWLAALRLARTSVTATNPSAWTPVGSGTLSGVGYVTPFSPSLYVLGNKGDVSRIAEDEPPDGGAATPLFTLDMASNATWLGLDGAHAFVLARSTTLCSNAQLPCVIASDGQGNGAAQLADADGATKLVLDGGRLFFEVAGVVQSIAPGEAAPTVLAQDSSNSTTSIAADASDVYWTVGLLGAVDHAPRGGGPTAALASGLAHPRLAVAAAGLLAWVTDDGLMGCDPADCTGSLQTYVASSQATVSSLAVDAKSIYWTDPNRAGVYRIAR